ncbi:MAG: DNA translocase FtsK [Gemmatimonadota bacterium]
MLSQEQKRDLLALGLLALSLFLLLALLPVQVLGPVGTRMFPSGNAMGDLGTVIRTVLVAALGGASVLVPLLLLVGGLHAGAWVSRSWAIRLGVLGLGLLLVVPPLFHLAGTAPRLQGWLGETVGAPLVSWVGWLGAGLILGVLLAALSVGTLGWNPLRSFVRAVAGGSSAAGRTARRAGALIDDLKARAPGSMPGVEEVGGAEAEWGGDGWGPDDRDGSEADYGALGVGAAEADGGRSGRGRGRGKSRGRGGAFPGNGSTGSVTAEVGASGDLPDPTDPALLADQELPPLDLLQPAAPRDRARRERELDRLGEVLVEKLDTFNVQCEVAGRTTGPVVTQFELVPAPGIKVNKIANLDADLALAMKAESVRIVAPIPGKGAVGVEIPNPDPEMVRLRELLESPAFRKSRARLPIAMGKDLTGDAFIADLSRMPHLLIAGATGSGKSVCLNSIVTSLVYRHTPETLRFLMIDPKMVELSAYVDLPHLRHPVVTDPKDAAGVLKWAVLEMERRYALLSANGVRSVAEFNKRVRDEVTVRRAEPEGEEGDPDRWIYDEGLLPYVVVVVDELADLMMTVQSDVEKPLTQLAQKARAIGVHLIIATQRPSVNVITGLIKANFPTRIAFRVASKTDSRTILDQNGADALLGNGDMLFLQPSSSEPTRIQAAFLSTEDTDRLTSWYREQAARQEEGEEAEARRPGSEADILELVRAQELEDAAEAVLEPDSPEDWDELFRAAGEICITHDQGSTSLLQRKLRVGYGRAARIVDQLHDAGVLGPPDGTRPRDVLVDLDDLEEICSSAKGFG